MRACHFSFVTVSRAGKDGGIIRAGESGQLMGCVSTFNFSFGESIWQGNRVARRSSITHHFHTSQLSMY
jgi:hypothetical protein